VTRTSVPASLTTSDVGFLLAKASQRVNDLLIRRFAEAGFPEVRASYGSVLVPLFEQDGLRLGELATRSHLSKQAITGLVHACERDMLVARRRDPHDGRAFVVSLTRRGQAFAKVAERVTRELEEELVAVIGARNHQALVRALKGVIRL
jgi:DNA-binding MarR family transcriptional regulator